MVGGPPFGGQRAVPPTPSEKAEYKVDILSYTLLEIQAVNIHSMIPIPIGSRSAARVHFLLFVS